MQVTASITLIFYDPDQQRYVSAKGRG